MFAFHISVHVVQTLTLGDIMRGAASMQLDESRHHAVNDVIAADIPVTKEQSGLFPNDVTGPGGITLVPWQGGKVVAWDVTVDSYVGASSTSSAAATEQAACSLLQEVNDLPVVASIQIYFEGATFFPSQGALGGGRSFSPKSRSPRPGNAGWSSWGGGSGVQQIPGKFKI